MSDATTPGQPPTVGFIGLGSQGGPMARRIVEAGLPTFLWARRPEAVAPFRTAGAEPLDSLAELAGRCDHIGICVFDDAAVCEVVDAMLPCLRKGTIICIHSTIHPETCVALADRAATRGVSVIDAPVSGGGAGAAAGTLTTMVGGETADVEAAMPVLETFSSLIVHLGGVGAGQLAKLVNNALMAATIGVADAAIEAAAKLSIDRLALAELVQASSGRSFGFDIRAGLAQPSAFADGARLLGKDVALLVDVLRGDAAASRLRDAAAPFLARARASLQGE